MPSAQRGRNLLDWLSLLAAFGLIAGVATASLSWKHDPIIIARAAH
jgi:hypothetical protein